MLHEIPVKATLRNSALYRTRAEGCLREARAQSLPNVREQLVRAAAAWHEMYVKAAKFEEMQALRH